MSMRAAVDALPVGDGKPRASIGLRDRSLRASLLCMNTLAWASMRRPVKLVSMMKLTTPATASAPYTDEAPPVSTSTRLISADGMKLMSGTGSADRPASGGGR